MKYKEVFISGVLAAVIINIFIRFAAIDISLNNLQAHLQSIDNSISQLASKKEVEDLKQDLANWQGLWDALFTEEQQRYFKRQKS